MKKSQRLQVIVDLKVDQEQKDLKLLGESQRQHQEMVDQLEHLTQYRQEYLDKFKQNNSGMNIQQLQEFRAFVHKLDTAIEGQEQNLQGLEKDLVKKRKSWLKSHQKTKSLQKVQDIAAHSEQSIVERNEQKAQDESASRGARFNGMDDA